MNMSLLSPDKNIKIEVQVSDSGEIVYSIEYKKIKIFTANKLGLIRKDADFSKNMKFISSSKPILINDNYTLLHGKTSKANYTAKQKVFKFQNSKNQNLDIIFSISNDGVGFRYYFPDKSDSIYKITKEITSYTFNDSTKVWIQPMSAAKTGWCQVNPSYEEYYEQDILIKNLPENKPGWVFPALFKTNNSWVSLTETSPNKNYCGSRLIHLPGTFSMQIGFPDSLETKNNGASVPESTLPWHSPWRIISIGDNLGNLVESTLGTDLAEPSKISDCSFVKPGRSSWSWVLYKDDSTVYDVQKRFIDYSSKMGWEYCLVDADWDKKIGYDKIKELCDYSATKNVGILAWYNSSGDWNTTVYSPKSKLLTHESRVKEFKKIKEIGVKGIKVDFFAGDGQSMMAYYQEIFEDAATFELMVNCHGATLPRGIQRTYPNLLTMESIKGFEFVTFEQKNANVQANHCTIIPFTRNLFDPMDFTPVCFSEPYRIKRITSNAFELALSVIFTSGIQHYAEVPEGMAQVPLAVQQFLKNVPVNWDETKFIQGYPGKNVIIARRKGNKWFVGGINGEEKEKDFTMDLSFIKGIDNIFITDGQDNRSFNIQKNSIDFSKPVKITMLPNGGFVIQSEISTL